jgi:hypothetical protein
MEEEDIQWTLWGRLKVRVSPRPELGFGGEVDEREWKLEAMLRLPEERL